MGGAVMAHPTDDELEAMAVRLEDGRVCSRAQNSCRNGYWMLEAAAMLRACKGRVKSRICKECDGNGKRHFMRQTPHGPVDDADECRACEGEGILAALDPAPDQGERQAYIKGTQSGWDAAIEAAVKVIDARKSVLEVGTELSDRVRTLKKGPAHE